MAVKEIISLTLLCLIASVYGQSRFEASQSFLERFGYLKPRSVSNPTHTFPQIREALRRFQQFVRLPATGILDLRTLRKMNQPRCGIPDIIDRNTSVSTDPNIPPAFTTTGTSWNKRDFTYDISGYTSKLTVNQQNAAMARALRNWADVAPLNFQQVTSGPADLDIFFASRFHGDGNPFDGSGRVLAHAYFPRRDGNPLAGDAHFDDDENWTLGTGRGIDMEIVAAHEFGHSMGLDHTDFPGALMEPFYSYSPNYGLSSDDIAGIRSLYGTGRGTVTAIGDSTPPTPAPTSPTTTTTTSETPAPTTSPTSPTTTTTTTAAPTGAPTTTAEPTGPYCDVQFQAVMEDDEGTVYGFSGSRAYVITPEGAVTDFLFRQRWRLAPRDPDAVLFDRTANQFFFFKGSRYWRYTTSRFFPGFGFFPDFGFFPRSLGSPFRNSDGGLQWDDNRIFLLRGDSYTQWSDGQRRESSGYPRSTGTFWAGAPEQPDAVFHSQSDDFTYFFKGQQYWKFDLSGNLQSGYPRDMRPTWLQCGTYQPR